MAWLAGAGSEPVNPVDVALRHRVIDALDAVHFCMAASGGASASQSPYEFGRNLARQFAASNADYARLLLEALDVKISGDVRAGVNYGEMVGVKIENISIGDPVSLYYKACVPLRSICEADPKRQFVILVDALDEAELAPSVSTIGQLVADSVEFPAGVRFLVSSRPVEQVLARFSPDAVWDIVNDAPKDGGDVADYILVRARMEGIRSDHPVIDKIIQSSFGNFLYAKTVLDFWLPRASELNSPTDLPLPHELDGIYAAFLQREYQGSPRWGDKVRPLLGALGVAQEPLVSPQLQFILEESSNILQDSLRRCQPYLDGQRPRGPFDLYHHSFREFLFNGAKNINYSVDPHEAHALTAQRYANTYRGNWDACDDDYGLRYSATHLAHAATSGNSYLRDQYVDELLSLLADHTFEDAHQARLNDPVALKGDFEMAVQRACEGQGDQALRRLLDAVAQAERFQAAQFDPAKAFTLAEQGDVAAAERHIVWFCLERRWDQLARLLISWLALSVAPWEGRALLMRVTAEDVDDPLISDVRQMVEHEIGLSPRPPVPRLPPVSEHTVQEILSRMAGTGGHEEVLLSEVENPSYLANFARGIVIGREGMEHDGSAYLGAVDGPYLVAFAAFDNNGSRYLDEYLALQSRNSYAFYRSRSLWALIPSIMAHPDTAWVRHFMRRLVESALAPSPVNFDEQVPIAAAALDLAGGSTDDAEPWNAFAARAESLAESLLADQPSRHEMAQGAGDRWARHKRRMCALAETVALLFRDPDRAGSMVDLALALPPAFAGFESPACLTLAETAHIVRPGDRASTRAAIELAGVSAHCCQDPAFCARTTARFNALALRWWQTDAMVVQELDIASLVHQFRKEPQAPEFTAIHVVGERYKGRQPPPFHLPFHEWALEASTLRDIARLYERPLDGLLRVNRQLEVGPDEDLPADTRVNVPDDDLVRLLATFLSARVLTHPGLLRVERAKLIQLLIPTSLTDRTATQTLIARRLLVSRPQSASVRSGLNYTLPSI
ncbi:hypothetical protein [Terrabacter sp. Soil810]|uniref:hypothetical protein n=1 Tax=Terrabacter sp. Soil810 TaxID=1736418 RepID=UPI0012FB52AF|nr:hypothetical protein [Terrabacter sp. Soil810]